MWQRRDFLRAAGAGFAAGLLPRRALALERAELVFASAVQTGDSTFGAALVTDRGDVLSTIGLPDRGHDITFSPTTGEAVIFARQPGTFAVVFDLKGDRAPITLASRPDRHFFGHGVFSPDGRLLYVTENDFDDARGVIGIYDVAGGYARMGEFDTAGIGPHEVLLAPDGRTLVVANGGIETHPDYGRAELNIATMDSSVSFIDLGDGHLRGQMRLDPALHQNSIRHMSFDRDGRAWFGCQYRGPATDQPPLVGFATLDGDITMVDLPPAVLSNLRNYVGSVAASADGSLIGVSSPEGDSVIAIDATTRNVVASQSLRDCCGLAPLEQGFLATSGDGRMVGLADGAIEEHGFELFFDNHLRVVPSLL
jgi:hypothetical protein